MISNGESAFAQSSKNAAHELTKECIVFNRSKCWQRLESYLIQQPNPISLHDREDQLFNYYILAKHAHFSGDHVESEQFYAAVMKLAVDLPIIDGDKEFYLTPIVHFDLAMLFLSMHAYDKALTNLGAANEIAIKDAYSEDFTMAISCARVATLMGLNRLAEAESLLAKILASLNYAAMRPWEGTLIGPEPLDPYTTGRKIARIYQRLGQEEEAIHLLDLLEEQRSLVIRRFETAKEPKISHGPWASETPQSDILNDKAEIYISQGKIREAEALLLPILRLTTSADDSGRKRALLKLAFIKKNKGELKEAEQLTQQALSIKIKEQERQHDPMLATFGFIK